MRAMILAAGRGERLRPITDTIPKPMVKVGDKELLLWHILKLKKAGITQIIVNSAHLSEKIVSFLKENERRVFELVLQGKNNDQIKDELFLGLHTVENYVSYILNISNCKNRKQLIEKFC